MSDGNGGTVDVPVNITVTPVKDLSAANDVATVDEDKTVQASVAGNDSTISGGTLVYNKTTDPKNGTLTFNANGTYTYTPKANFNGTDSFTYTVKDPASGEELTQTVNITVKPVVDLSAKDDVATTEAAPPLPGAVSITDRTINDRKIVTEKTTDQKRKDIL